MLPRQRTLRPSDRDSVKLWSAATIIQFGTQVSQLALPFIAIQILDASAFAVAALATVEVELTLPRARKMDAAGV